MPQGVLEKEPPAQPLYMRKRSRGVLLPSCAGLYLEAAVRMGEDRFQLELVATIAATEKLSTQWLHFPREKLVGVFETCHQR